MPGSGKAIKEEEDTFHCRKAIATIKTGKSKKQYFYVTLWHIFMESHQNIYN